MAFSLLSRRFLKFIWNEEGVRRISISSVRLSEDESSKKSSAADKLHSLLQDIIKDDSLTTENVKTRTSEPVILPVKKKRPEKTKNLGEKIVDSAKEIAKGLDGKPEETEAQLLHRVLYKNKPLAESVAKAAANDTLKELLSGMEIETTPTVPKQKPMTESGVSRAEQVRMELKNKPFFRPSRGQVVGVKIDLFGEKPLGIFKREESSDTGEPLPTWEEMEQRELQLLVTHPPSNIYEQMIQWTERGMLWKFPINNEQGLDEEEKVDFTEHIFLENHLEDWCPDKGPIRHFMELVCVGLSRNHWLTAEEKKQHILWYRDYFSKKKALLQELELGEIKAISAN
ncbi:small ribosomal subunit protein mS31 [Halyomorpha halys]|uniref:small ribosomal subunit protein mS31 n=1 Tax=Halyomorpha halys TaxID=286706 RepID=UPI0006D4F32E|nr:28S ribosomal protein S31, mitochondrial [Halyomorpha halys]